MMSVNLHLLGHSPDAATTFESWRSPAFLLACRKVVLARKRGWLLGVVNGVFDLLHVGHVNLITQASLARGGRSVFLVALLNSDESAARMKGPDRPYAPLAARMRMVSAVKGIDLVAGFPEDTPEAALAMLEPDVLFKGEEYAGQYIPGQKTCKEVVLIPMTEGFHTTNIVSTIVARHKCCSGAPLPSQGSRE